MNKILDEDIKELAGKKQYFSDFENSSILITGATGLIGSIITKAILEYNKNTERKIIVYVNCRSSEKFNKIFGDYKCKELIPIFSDINSINLSEIKKIDYVIHGASVTDSKAFVTKPVETINTALVGTMELLNQLKEKSIKGFVYLSSLEVYGTFTESGIKNVKEADYGYIENLSVRSSYSEGKRMTECLCVSYAQEYQIPIKIVRLCQTFGAGVDYADNRVFAQFARSVIEGKDIVLKTKGETIRNYCYTTDAVTGILTVLSKGIVGEAYNIANMATTISIAEMAEMFCNIYPEKNIHVVFDIAEDVTKLGYNPVVKIQLDTSKLNFLGWTAEVSFDQMIKRLVNSLL